MLIACMTSTWYVGGCDCKNKWSGSTCNTCAPPFTGASCDKCLNSNFDIESNCLKCIQGRFGSNCEYGFQLCNTSRFLLSDQLNVVLVGLVSFSKFTSDSRFISSSLHIAYGEWSMDSTKFSYTVLTPVTTKSEAESVCQGRNAQLVSLRSSAERDFVALLWSTTVGNNAWTGYEALCNHVVFSDSCERIYPP